MAAAEAEAEAEATESDVIEMLLANLDPSHTLHRGISVLREPAGPDRGEGRGGGVLLAADDAARIMGVPEVDAVLSVLHADQQRIIEGRTYIDGRGLVRALARLVLPPPRPSPSSPARPCASGGKRRRGEEGGRTARDDAGGDTGLYVAMDPSNKRIEQVYDSLDAMVEEGHFTSLEEARRVIDQTASGVGRFMRWQSCPRTLKASFATCGGTLPSRPRESGGSRPWRRVDRRPDDGQPPQRFRSMNAAAASVGGDCAALKEAIARGVPWRGSVWSYAQDHDDAHVG